jgi:hypothetical protein
MARQRDRLVRVSRIIDIAFWLTLGFVAVALVQLAREWIGPGAAAIVLVLPLTWLVWTALYLRRPVVPNDRPRRPRWW